MPDVQSYHEKSTIDRAFLIKAIVGSLSRIAPWPASAVAERLFITSPRSPAPAREETWAENAERFSVPSAGAPLAAWVWGEGPRTVLLVHGWAGRGLQLGAFATPLVARGYRVVAFDGPGHGASPGRTSSMPELARGIEAMCRNFAPVEAVVAHSLGCAATILALSGEVLEAEKVIALAPPARLGGILDWFSEKTGFSTQVVNRMRTRLETRFDFSWENAEPLRLATTMTASLLVVHDLEDREIPHASGAALADAWPDANLLTTTDLGHRKLLRDADVIEKVVDFICPQHRLPPQPMEPIDKSSDFTGGNRTMKTSVPLRARTQNWCYGCASKYLGINIDLKGLRLDDQDIVRDLNYGRNGRPGFTGQSGMPGSAAEITSSGSDRDQITA